MRLDQYLCAQGLCPSRSFAQEEIQKGLVRINGRICCKSATRISESDQVRYEGSGRSHVSRGAQKLQGAFAAFPFKVTGCRCFDVGASTGGFTQVLLEKGAHSVTCIDVGHDQLNPLLREDPRVEDRSGLNFRHLPQDLEARAGQFQRFTMDVSFISVTLLLENAERLLALGGEGIVLIKPQFEAGRGALSAKGVVVDPQKHEEVLQRMLPLAATLGLSPQGLTFSPIKGPEGTIEYLLYVKKMRLKDPKAVLESFTVRAVVEEAFAALQPPKIEKEEA
ncbi:RNA binding methyltransferase FtsJ like protein [Clostridiaceae bacterium JG1575]|nr:RNA binding methyltransferase FtsJ like protein [Clostridiaceae bacterium JG1575]